MRNNFKKLANNTCRDCKIDCCKKWEVFLSEYDKKRVRKIDKRSNLFNGNFFNTKDKCCPFYDENNKKCKIHKHKPLDCRIYPYSFWFESGKIELWLDLKCKLSQDLVKDKNYYNQVMMTAKEELVHWSEGEIFAYLISGFDIEKFKKQVSNKKRVYIK